MNAIQDLLRCRVCIEIDIGVGVPVARQELAQFEGAGRVSGVKEGDIAVTAANKLPHGAK